MSLFYKERRRKGRAGEQKGMGRGRERKKEGGRKEGRRGKVLEVLGIVKVRALVVKIILKIKFHFLIYGK